MELRKELADLGVDAGAHTIAVHLSRRHGEDVVPSVATIWRILSRRGFVTPQPQKRPRSSFIRFCAEMPNERWQADITHWRLAGGSEVEILNDRRSLEAPGGLGCSGGLQGRRRRGDVPRGRRDLRVPGSAAHRQRGGVHRGAPQGQVRDRGRDRPARDPARSTRAPTTRRPAGRWSGSTRRSRSGWPNSRHRRAWQSCRSSSIGSPRTTTP